MLYKSIVTFLLVFQSSISLNSQTILTKNEIFDRWTSENNVFLNDQNLFLSKVNLESDKLQSNIKRRINWFSQTQIDTFGFYIISSTAGANNDTCSEEYLSSIIYMFWRKNGNYFNKKIIDKSDFPTTLNSDLKSIFLYLGKNFENLKREFVMPVILRGELDINGGTKYLIVSSSHEENFIIYCKQGSEIKYLNFQNSAITDTENIFFQDNLKSSSFKWFQLIAGAFK